MCELLLTVPVMATLATMLLDTASTQSDLSSAIDVAYPLAGYAATGLIGTGQLVGTRSAAPPKAAATAPKSMASTRSLQLQTLRSKPSGCIASNHAVEERKAAIISSGSGYVLELYFMVHSAPDGRPGLREVNAREAVEQQLKALETDSMRIDWFFEWPSGTVVGELELVIVSAAMNFLPVSFHSLQILAAAIVSFTLIVAAAWSGNHNYMNARYFEITTGWGCSTKLSGPGDLPALICEVWEFQQLAPEVFDPKFY
ncbi:unnamed protein product [Symbiodinium microadriaticum]|nr:unnamed protein product [Symbiodinium microadriaticum]